jgi:predicted DNA-binding transcriptional regulator YafY
MRLHRLIAILLLIESRGTIKTKELAEALETSVRTIHRDIQILCESGIPITTATGPNGGVRFMEGYTANINSLQCDDIISLFLCGIGVRPVEHSESSLKLKTALLKLEKSLPAKYLPDIRMAKERFFFDPEPWWDERQPVEHLDLLRKSVWNSKKIEICYRKVNGELSQRIVHPYGLVVKMMNWYLVGYCEKSCKIAVFKCERIVKAVIIDDSFLYPDDFCLETFWNNSSTDFKTACSEKEYYPVEIRLDKRFSALLNDVDLIKKTEGGEFITASINLHSYKIAQTEVLPLVGRCEIISPSELRDHVRNVLKGLLDCY